MSNTDQAPALPDFDPFDDAGLAPSPCINVCRMDPRSGLCEGCLRTMDEIMQWSTAGESQKRAVWVEIWQRRVDPKNGVPR